MIESIFFYPWVWIVPIVLVLLLAVTILGVYFGWDDSLSLGWLVSFFFGLGFLGLAGGYFGGMLPPYDMSYHQVYRVTGEIESIERPFTAGDGVTGQSFVIHVEGIDLAISSSDQRFREVEVGDSVQLKCEKQFAYFTTPWYNCDFGG